MAGPSGRLRDPSPGGAATLRHRAERGLDLMNLLLSDVRYGLGAYLGVYLVTEQDWNPAQVGLALSAGGLAGLVAQTPVGLLVDAIRAKRLLLAVAVLVATGSCLAVPVAPGFLPVLAAGILGALAATSITPALAAISLGVVGPAAFARRAGRNEALFHLGNAVVNLLILALSHRFGSPVLFGLMLLTGIASMAAVLLVPAAAIDHAVARGLLAKGSAPVSAWRLLRSSRPLLVFALAGALFHMGNSSMLALVAQKLALQNIGWGIALTAACAIAAQSVMVPTAALASTRADAWGRRPLMLAAFVALVLRGVLYTLWDAPAWLVGVQLLDGFAAGMVGALFPVIVADLTRGSGRFNAAQGVVGTIHGLGGLAGAALSGFIVVEAGFDAAFLTLAAIAALGGLLFWARMPESRGAPQIDQPG